MIYYLYFTIFAYFTLELFRLFCPWTVPFANHKGVIQAVFEIGSQFWTHKNWRPNFDELAKKLAKPNSDITESIIH